ncbi:Growth regulation protein [Rhodotorula toruloides]|uniref:BY PROTMAP: gi/472586985/gb/EMS24484.1/ phosphatase activator [Rhodosporidium toruloides NP11] gi/647394830/emb/CDR36064.1/ RHTO0S01e13410g1_1 [Rhodosporidium toruloides] n=1 Tax=Rhodotorula toruloides TaxID=5286 RepID=A0A0K3CDQ1_RHOTO|nr:Growth regulation protein [Rhodotorula toruloides]PRQ76844.1 hypothetical protein AAT19DRAFT_12262 [Rhodotorula toruloides]
MSFANSTKVALDLRGARLSLDREALMELPESVLLCLFPNGVVLSPQRQPRGEGEEEDEEADVYYVDFDARCLEFVLDFFATAREAFYGRPDGPRRDLSLTSPIAQSNMSNPLFLKQAIIVLREELEYFAIPPGKNEVGAKDGERPGMDENGKPNAALTQLKIDCGNALLDQRSIFTALQRNVSRDNNVAEQHLIDMLCMSGFERDDAWGYRSIEPNRCCIASIALVLLKTGIVHPPLSGSPPVSPSDESGPDAMASSEEGGGVQVNTQQLATAQKLLLFWRKPARKAWWDSTDVTVRGKNIKVWARRVWTLELSLI